MQTPLTEKEFEELILSVGTHRKRRHLRPVEAARRIREALASGVLYPSGLVRFTSESLAKKLGWRDASMVPRFLALSNVPGEFQEVVEWGSRAGAMSHLTFSIASAVSTLSPSLQRELFVEVFKHELTKSEAISIVQTLRRNPSMSAQDAVNEIVASRPVKVYHEVLLGSFPPESPMASPSLPTGRKEAVLNAVLKTIFDTETVAGRISERHFLISTTENGKRLFLDYCKRQRTGPNELIAKLCKERLSS